MSVAASMAGSIIGHGGSILKMIQNESGARVNLEQKDQMAPGAIERKVLLDRTFFLTLLSIFA